MSGNPATQSSASGTPSTGTAEHLPPPPKSNRTPMIVVLVVVVVVIAAVVGYGAYAGWFKTSSGTNLSVGVTCTQPISGAGSTFVFPAMSSWAQQFGSATNGCITPAYNPVGSGAGITQLTQKAVQFGASDAPLSYSQTKALPGPAMTIPDAIGPVTVVYNNVNALLPKGLNLSGTVIADIYLGTITNWNDPAIAAINPHVTLPNQAIAVVYRADSSGTSFVFTSWLSAESSTWASQVGAHTLPAWPVGAGQRGSGGVVGAVGSTPGGIGYAELNYAAFGSGVTTASVENPAGNFVQPTIASTEPAAAAIAGSLPPGSGNWSAVNMLNQPGAGTYPIATFTYIMVYVDMGAVFGSTVSQSQAQAVVNFIWWIIHDGQGISSGLYYVPLPDSVVNDGQTTLNQMVYNGNGYQMP